MNKLSKAHTHLTDATHDCLQFVYSTGAFSFGIEFFDANAGAIVGDLVCVSLGILNAQIFGLEVVSG